MDKESGDNEYNLHFLLINMQKKSQQSSRYINVHSMSLECNCFVLSNEGF